MNSLCTLRLTTLKVISGEVTALASHQCGSRSIPLLGVIYGLSWFSTLLSEQSRVGSLLCSQSRALYSALGFYGFALSSKINI